MDCSTPGSLSFTISRSLLKLTFVQLVMPSNHLILCHTFSCLQSFPASASFPMSGLITSGGQSIRASASASVLPVDIQGWFSFRINLFDILAIQKTWKSLLQHHNSKASILWCSASLTVQLSHPYMTFGKTIVVTMWIIVSKCMSLLSRFVIAFLQRSKHLLILWLQSLSTMILGPQKINSVASTFFPFYLPWSGGTRY